MLIQEMESPNKKSVKAQRAIDKMMSPEGSDEESEINEADLIKR